MIRLVSTVLLLAMFALKVMWSDETKINYLGSDGRKYVGEGLSDRLVEGTMKFGGGKLMLWGCMGWAMQPRLMGGWMQSSTSPSLRMNF